MEKEIRDNVTYFEALQKQVDESIVDGAYEVFLTQAAQLCDAEQVDRLKALFKKYEKMQENIKAVSWKCNVCYRHKARDEFRPIGGITRPSETITSELVHY
ncbi:unnamed protein product [Heligmosomoides polygyrus]|uniref:ING domain-containing protein n=1 Tax=Heligmosomoides polygyrus TaxID=6339 RepID=A0A183FXC1_HELPZ|nr:unnamed protein product [Heligmosomoides polygyrus]